MLHFLSANWSLAGPSALILALLSAGVILSWTKRRAAGRALCLAGTVCLLAITFLPLDSWALRPLEQRFPPQPLPAHVDGIVVLGGMFDDSIADTDGMPGLSDSAERLTNFVRLSRLYPEAKLVFTGGSRATPGEPTEADAVRKMLGDFGVDLTRVTLERASRNSYENAVFTKGLVKPNQGETWLLVTSAAHMPRAVGTFRHIGWQVIAASAGYKASTRYTVNLAQHLKRFDDAMHEWLGLAAYRLEGRTDVLFPGPD